MLVNYLLPKLLAVVGTYAVSEIAIKPIFTFIQNKVMAGANGLPADVLGFLNFCGFTDAVSIVFSAFSLALAIKAGKAAAAKKGGK